MRARARTAYPFWSRTLAVSNPIPVFPPVISTRLAEEAALVADARTESVDRIMLTTGSKLAVIGNSRLAAAQVQVHEIRACPWQLHPLQPVPSDVGS